MSILVRGMDMPKEGNETIIRIQPDGTVLDQYGHHLAITAVPVPPHGRLIDADALNHEYYKSPSYLNLCNAINAAPTIIEAEEGEG